MVSYLGGNIPSIVNPIPWGLIPQVGSAFQQYQMQDIAYDYAIAGIPFLSGESLRGTYFRRMYVREFAPIRKDQFDNQQVPGEQSILGWWLRSQSNFSQGSGIQYLDTTVDQTLGERYYYSEHIDTLSVPGSISLTQATKQLLSSTSAIQHVRGVNIAGTDYVLVADLNTLKRIDINGTSTSYTMPVGFGAWTVSMTDDGVNYYLWDGSAIWQGALNTPATPATLIWNTSALASAPGGVIAWIKGRLIAALGGNVYELVGSGPTLPPPKFSSLYPRYLFTGITSTPTSILVAGYSVSASGAPTSFSEIYKFTLDSSGALPVLSGGAVAATMPTGEFINTIYGYLGSFVGIGTSKGFRVATVDLNGNLTYGPLIFQNPNGVYAVGGYDRFLLVGNTNNATIPQQGFVNPVGAATTSGLIKVDLSQNTSTGGFPWTVDIDTHGTGRIVEVCNFGTSGANAGLMVMVIASNVGAPLVNGLGVFVTDSTKKESSGVLYTSRIRYNTLEDKHFKYLFVRNQPITDGSIQVSAIDPSGGNTSIVNLGVGTQMGSNSAVLISNEGNQTEWLQLAFTFTRGISNSNVSPVMNGYQMRALPGVNRQILLTIPLSCHDFESDKFGNPVGFDGSANARLSALESFIASGNLVLFQDLNYGTANLVILDDYRFEQQANEQPKAGVAGGSDSNARGGYITLTARVIQ